MRNKQFKPLHDSIIDALVALEESLIIRAGVNMRFIIAFRMQSEVLIDLVKRTEIEKRQLSLMVVNLERFRQKFNERYATNPFVSNGEEIAKINNNLKSLSIHLTERITDNTDKPGDISAN